MEDENIIDELKITFHPKTVMLELKKDPLFISKQNELRREYGFPLIGIKTHTSKRLKEKYTNKRTYQKEYKKKAYIKFKAQKNKITNPTLKTSDIITHDPLCGGVRCWNNERKAYTCDKCSYVDPITYTPQ